jgi:hypothetical protein
VLIDQNPEAIAVMRTRMPDVPVLIAPTPVP